jgi:hypothetical protein
MTTAGKRRHQVLAILSLIPGKYITVRRKWLREFLIALDESLLTQEATELMNQRSSEEGEEGGDDEYDDGGTRNVLREVLEGALIRLPPHIAARHRALMGVTAKFAATTAAAIDTDGHFMRSRIASRLQVCCGQL